MNCPSCSFANAEKSRYCGRCRMSFARGSLWFSRFRDNLFWIFRRSNAGFMSGLVAWAFIPALSRVLSQDASASFYFALEGLLGGAFLGTVDGMVEESTPKTLTGALIGGFCGAIGGAVFGYFSPGLSAQQTVWGLCAFWAFAGAGIGMVSAIWERDARKVFFGVMAGLVGGGIGGGLRYAVYAYLIEEVNPQGWMTRRLFEGLSGGVIGVTLWFAIAWAERFVIFNRKRLDASSTYKICHHCKAHNPLPQWYCAGCGSVLQEAAAPESLNLSPYATLSRFKSFLEFMSRLSATSGVIAGVVIFIVFLPVNAMLAFVAAIIVAIASYGFQGLFTGLSETVRIFLARPR